MVLEKDLPADPKWNAYTTQLTTTKRLVQQTELAALQPPTQRSKARFMNTSLYINWPNRILKSKAAGYLDEIPKERYEKYFGWLEEYDSSLLIWEQKVGIVEIIKSTLRQHGLSKDAYNHLRAEIEAMPLEVDVEDFKSKAFASINEEVKKLDEDQILPVFTESLESVFGSFKYHTSRGRQGITGIMLTIATLVGSPLKPEEMCNAFEETSVRRMLAWVERKIGSTLAKLRNKFFNGSKQTKFDSKALA